MVCFPYVKQPDDYIYSLNLIHCKRRDLNQRPFSNSRFFSHWAKMDHVFLTMVDVILFEFIGKIWPI